MHIRISTRFVCVCECECECECECTLLKGESTMTDVNNICVNLREVPKLATTESLYRFCNPESTPPQYETNYHYIKATTEYTKKEKKKKEPSLKTKEIETKVENFNIDEMIPSIERPHSLSTSAYNDSSKHLIFLGI